MTNESYKKARNLARSKRTLARRRGATVIEYVMRHKIYQRDEGVCGICNLPVELEDLTIDHVVPINRGGQHTNDNAQVAHRLCNALKRNRLQEEISDEEIVLMRLGEDGMRKLAILDARDGLTFTEIGRRLHRNRKWVSKVIQGEDREAWEVARWGDR